MSRSILVHGTWNDLSAESVLRQEALVLTRAPVQLLFQWRDWTTCVMTLVYDIKIEICITKQIGIDKFFLSKTCLIKSFNWGRLRSKETRRFALTMIEIWGLIKTKKLCLFGMNVEEFVEVAAYRSWCVYLSIVFWSFDTVNGCCYHCTCSSVTYTKWWHI